MILKKTSVFNSLLSHYIIVFIVISMIIIFFSYRIIKDVISNETSFHAEKYGRIVGAAIKDNLVTKDFGSIEGILSYYANILDGSIIVIGPDGNVIAASSNNVFDAGNYKNVQEVYFALRKKAGSSIRYNKFLHKRYAHVAVPVFDNETVIGVVRISNELHGLAGSVENISSNIVSLFIILFVIIVIFSYVLTRRIAEPLKELSRASIEVAKGNFDISVFPHKTRYSEIEILENNFNVMAAKLKSLFRELNYEKAELDSIITSINESIVVIDNNDMIVRANEGFCKLFDNQDVIGKFYWEVIRDPYIEHIIKAKKINALNELYVKDMILLYSLNYLRSKKGLVLVFYDITELKKLENIKKDIVSNVSHELRTPLTAIKGFAETLLDDETDEIKRKYLLIIEKHTERLIHIVKNLLVLSELEKVNNREGVTDFNSPLITDLNVETIDLKHYMYELTNLFEDKLKTKSLILDLNVKDHVASLEADPFKLEQVFINLIDNAIKYTDKGRIDVSVDEVNGEVIIKISDTGIGIPDEHINRIFERFYVVDKSRSKKTGGAGLGLAIVKHVITLHNGRIDIESEPDKGTTFKICLPVKHN